MHTEKIEMNDNQPFRVKIQKINRYPIHWHEGIAEIILPIQGDVEVVANFERLTIKEGEFHFINNRSVHSISSSSNAVVALIYVNLSLYEQQFDHIKYMFFRSNPFVDDRRQLGKDLTDIQDSYHQHAGGIHTGLNFSTYDDGTFADRIKIRSADMNLALLPEGVSLEAAAMVTDMMTTGFHGAELGKVKYGDTVAVFGIGPVGLMAVAGSALMGAGKIIAVGTRPDCVKLAREYGATDIVSYKEGSVKDQIMALTGGTGLDVAIVAGGDQETFYTAIGATKPEEILPC